MRVRFFTRSVRKSRNGQVVFLLDRKTDRRPAALKDLPFSTLCREYLRALDRLMLLPRRVEEHQQASLLSLAIRQIAKDFEGSSSSARKNSIMVPLRHTLTQSRELLRAKVQEA